MKKLLLGLCMLVPGLALAQPRRQHGHGGSEAVHSRHASRLQIQE
jgi:hypothetical protein